MYLELFNNFFLQNKRLIITNTVLTILIYPLEIILLTYLSGLIFLHINNNNTKMFLKFIIYFIMTFLFIVICYYFTEKIDCELLPKLQTSVRYDIYDMTQSFNNDESKNINSGETMTSLLKIPMYMYLNYTNIINFILPFIFSIFIFTIYMFYIHYSIGLSTLLFYLIFLIIYVSYYNRTMIISRYRYIVGLKLMDSFEDTIANYDNIRSNNSSEFEKERLNENEIRYQKSMKLELDQICVFKILFIVSQCFFMLFIILLGCFLVMKNKVPLFKFIMLTTAILMMIRLMTTFIRRITDSANEFGPMSSSKIDNTQLNKKKVISSSNDKIILNNESKFDILIKDLHYSFSKLELYNNINIYIPFKSNILITGSIGTGKSTLFKLILGDLKISRNTIFFNDIDINDLDIKELKKYVYIMHQHIKLFKRSVLENIFYGMKKDTNEWNKNLNILKNLFIYKNIKSYIYNNDATLLSGGQKQIVLLLRCYFKTPKILLLDEPTASLDSNTKKILLSILDILKTKCTIICISHDISLISNFKTHYHLENKNLIKKSLS